jgi:hypothetical protein
MEPPCVPPPPECLDQQPNQVNGLFADNCCDICAGVQYIAEAFMWTFDGTLEAIEFWGGYYPGNVPLEPDIFTVNIREDDGAGNPGAILYSFAGIPADDRVDTGVDLFGVDEYKYVINLAGVALTAGGPYYVDLYNSTCDNTDDWFWETGDNDPAHPLGQHWSPVDPPDGAWNYDSSMDMALVLTCNYDVGGPCGDYVIGDYNCSGAANVADVVEMYSKLKTGSPTYPDCECDCENDGNVWPVGGDVNNSCAMNVADVVALYSKLKTGEPELVPCLLCPPDSYEPSPGGGDRPLVVPNLESKAKLKTGSGMD